MSETRHLLAIAAERLAAKNWRGAHPTGDRNARPIPHHEIIGALIETLGFRHIGVVHDEYAVSPDGMKMFGVLDLANGDARLSVFHWRAQFAR
jgi:hypothetical protein